MEALEILARTLYPEMAKEADGGYFSGPGDYEPIVLYVVPDVLFRFDDGDYQGDTFVFGRDAMGKFVWLEFGWGSCSGCDALQGCHSPTEIGELAEKLRDGARRWASAADALDWWLKHDWEGDYHAEKLRDLREAVRLFLEKEVAR